MKKKELNDFEDTFNLNGEMYELFVKSNIFLTLKCLEEDDKNKFHFIYNISKQNFDKSIKDFELDFVINNLDIKLFKSFLVYFSGNILFFKFRDFTFEINNSENTFLNIISNINNIGKINIIGELGLSAWKDKKKAEQFSKYNNLLQLLKEKKIIIILILSKKELVLMKKMKNL